MVLCNLNCYAYYLGDFKKIGLLLIFTSGHTADHHYHSKPPFLLKIIIYLVALPDGILTPAATVSEMLEGKTKLKPTKCVE